MKKSVPVILVVVVLLAGGFFTWRSFDSGSSGENISGFPIVCRHCGHFFTIDEENVYTYPKDPGGAGFKCEKCGKFGGTTGVKCTSCGGWFITDRTGGAGTQCPKCAPPGAAERSGT